MSNVLPLQQLDGTITSNICKFNCSWCFLWQLLDGKKCRCVSLKYYGSFQRRFIIDKPEGFQKTQSSFSRGCVCVCQSLSCVQVLATPWTVAYKTPLSMEFSRKEYRNGLPFPSPGDLSNPGTKLASPALQVDSLHLSHQRSSQRTVVVQLLSCVQLCTPWTAACQASLSFTISQSLLRLMSIGLVMVSDHLILCHPLLLPSVFPSIRSFPVNQLFASDDQSIGASPSASVLPMNSQD